MIPLAMNLKQLRRFRTGQRAMHAAECAALDVLETLASRTSAFRLAEGVPVHAGDNLITRGQIHAFRATVAALHVREREALERAGAHPDHLIHTCSQLWPGPKKARVELRKRKA
jgi:hypothetical protein